MIKKVTGFREKAFENLLEGFYFNLDKEQTKYAEKRIKKLKVPVITVKDVEKAFRFVENRKMKCPEDADELEDIFAFLRKRLFPVRKQGKVKK